MFLAECRDVGTQNHLADKTFDDLVAAEVAGIEPVMPIAFLPNLLTEDFLHGFPKRISEVTVVPGYGMFPLLGYDIGVTHRLEAAADVAVDEVAHKFLNVRVVLFQVATLLEGPIPS